MSENPSMLHVTELVHEVLRRELPSSVSDPVVHRAGQQVARVVRLFCSLYMRASHNALSGTETTTAKVEELVRQYFPIPERK